MGENDLISRAALHDRIKNYFCGSCWIHEKGLVCGGGCHEKIILDFIKEAPAVNAEPVKYARWLIISPVGWHGDGFYNTPKIKCSQCGAVAKGDKHIDNGHGGGITIYNWYAEKRCHKCDAKMNDFNRCSTCVLKMIPSTKCSECNEKNGYRWHKEYPFGGDCDAE